MYRSLYIVLTLYLLSLVFPRRLERSVHVSILEKLVDHFQVQYRVTSSALRLAYI